jgi:large subunit ribosomal protein L25
MERVTLDVEKRERKGKGAARDLRRNNVIPAVLYREGTSQPIQISKRELTSFISRSGGEQVVVNLNFADKTRQAIMKDYQIDPITSSLIHVDFQEILATEMLKIAVHIVTSGEAVGVKRDGGLLQHGIREIEIECLPDKIPGHVDVDVSPLGIGQSIHVGDLKLAEGIRVLTDPEELIVTVTSIKEEAAAPVAEEVETSEPEIIKKGKKAEEAEG